MATGCGVWFAGVAGTRPCCFCGVGRAATAPIQPLAWERPCAGGCGPYKTKEASNAISHNFWGGKLSILKASHTKGTEKMCYVELKIALNFQKPTSEGTDIAEL